MKLKTMKPIIISPSQIFGVLLWLRLAQLHNYDGFTGWHLHDYFYLLMSLLFIVLPYFWWGKNK